MDKNIRSEPACLEMTPEEFRRAGHQLVDRIAGFLGDISTKKVTPGEKPPDVRSFLGNGTVPDEGTRADQLLEEAAELLFRHSLFNGHPRFWGYITSSASPIGALGDLLASAVNPNAGGWALSPMASEIESQTIQWIAQLIGFPVPCGGLLVSGGNMANFVGFLAGRRAKAGESIRTVGLRRAEKPLAVYVSRETHTWIHKAADIFGLGSESVRWIPVDDSLRLNIEVLEKQIVQDKQDGFLPFMVVGAAGTVQTGAVDPLDEIADVCKHYNLWFHVDGAYGAPAAMLPEASPQLKALCEADSVAVDPHKWLYSPLEAGCTLVRNPQHLIDTFSFHPEYYNFDPEDKDTAINYYEMGPQNSRGFRALKIWLALRQAGRQGYVRMLRDDIALAEVLFEKIKLYENLEAFIQNLSITTFRYVPKDLTPGDEAVEEYLNTLNTELLNRLQAGGEAFISNALINGKFLLRACVVNFRTTLNDIEALPEIVIKLGKEVDRELRQENFTISEGLKKSR